jgi:hypothetical protein
MKCRISLAVLTFSFATGAQKVGHLDLTANFASELNKALPQHTQR